jgi:hypothetical protein
MDYYLKKRNGKLYGPDQFMSPLVREAGYNEGSYRIVNHFSRANGRSAWGLYPRGSRGYESLRKTNEWVAIILFK